MYHAIFPSAVMDCYHSHRWRRGRPEAPDDIPRGGSADIAASKKVAAERGSNLFHLGRRSADVAPTRTRGKGMAGRSADPSVKTEGQTR